MYLSWIIPSCDEEQRIEKTIREVDAYLRAKNFSDGYEIIVSNSASRDRTAEIVECLKSEFSCLKLLNLRNIGKGYAVKMGMLEAAGGIRLFSDADNSTAPEYFDQMETLFRQGMEVVISSRDSKDARGASRDVTEPWYREIMGNIGNLIIQIFGIWGIWDTQNGFKAFTDKAAVAIFSLNKMNGWSFDIEVLALARRMGYKIGIIPIKWRFAEGSKVTLRAYLGVFLDVFKIRWNLITNKYKI